METNAPIAVKEVKTKRGPKAKTPVGTDGTKTRLRHTNIFCTLNTNQNVQETSENYELMTNNLRAVINSVWNEDYLDRYVEIKEGAPSGSVVDAPWIKVDKCEIQYALELGPETGKLHAHIGIFIPHYTLLQLNNAKFREDLTNAMVANGFPNGFYYNVKFGAEAYDPVVAMKAYIAKNPCK